MSTRVGGVPEVLPPNMINLAEPTVPALVTKIKEAVTTVKRVNPFELHEQVKSMYNWSNIADRTEVVYKHVTELKSMTLAERIAR